MVEYTVGLVVVVLAAVRKLSEPGSGSKKPAACGGDGQTRLPLVTHAMRIIGSYVTRPSLPRSCISNKLRF